MKPQVILPEIQQLLDTLNLLTLFQIKIKKQQKRHLCVVMSEQQKTLIIIMYCENILLCKNFLELAKTYLLSVHPLRVLE